VRSLLAGRCALVMAQRDTDLALDVTEGLVQLGARVLLTCERPDECSHRVAFVNRRAAERRAAASAQALTAAGGGGRRRRRRRLEPELVEAGCVTAQLDLCDSSAIWDFADAFSAGGWPLHVIVSCSDERCAAGGGRAAEERCAAANHLGVQTLPAAPARRAPARRGPFAAPYTSVTAPPPPALRPVPAHVAPLRLARRDDAPRREARRPHRRPPRPKTAPPRRRRRRQGPLRRQRRRGARLARASLAPCSSSEGEDGCCRRCGRGSPSRWRRAPSHTRSAAWCCSGQAHPHQSRKCLGSV